MDINSKADGWKKTGKPGRDEDAVKESLTGKHEDAAIDYQSPRLHLSLTPAYASLLVFVVSP
jgi:hypothetical protein